MGLNNNPVRNMNRNPTGIGGFQERPQDRNSGGRPTNMESFTYWYREFKNMTVKEFLNWENEHSEEERTVAASLAYARVKKADESLKDFQEIADRTEGKAPQTLIEDGGLFSTDKLQIRVIDSNPETEPDKSVV